MFRKYDKEFNFPELEKGILDFWEKNDVFIKTLKLREPGERYVFYEGPPTANGLPGIHHALARTIKDTICRYKTMQGYYVERKAGWDTHGLPVELGVEEKLGIKSKDEIEKYGIENFNRECKESTFLYKTEWDEFTRKIGYWLDLEHPYITYTNDYIESVWWILKQYHDKGLLYQGHKIVPWCPRCGTALSSHEVAQGYEEVSDLSLYIKVKLRDSADTYFLVWTTTPWTLISNMALALAPNEPYVTVAHKGEKLILAKSRLKVLEGDYKIIDEKSGHAYERVKYEPLFDFMAREAGNAFFAATADFVTMDDGTGIVHIAPAFGADDYELGRKYGLPVVQAVDTAGRFIDKVKPWAGRFVKDADPEINRDLERRGLLYKYENYVHAYPFCWRCDTPLLYYARTSWFLRTTSYKDRMIEANKQIEWYPPEIGAGRFGEWLENNVDWALSRERYWGTPLPIWICRGCGHETAIGSIEQLRKEAVNLPEQLDLHRPLVDNIRVRCPGCGQEAHRVREVIDAWFDSGTMPYGQLHYPFEHADDFEREYFPAEFIAEGLDQTRGWFYSMLAISVFVSGRSSYKRCIVNNMVLDAEGKKMSKRLGNLIDPKDLLDKYGADALRWYLINGSAIWLPKRFDEKGVIDVLRKFFSTLQNSYSFFALYADVDKFDPASPGPDNPPLIDRWLVSRLNGVIMGCTEAYEQFDFTRATRLISTFVIDELSNWWIKRSRKRFWGTQMTENKLAAYHVLYESLLSVCQLTAPVSPFLAEDIYGRLTEGLTEHPRSVHQCNFPVADRGKVDKELDYSMDLAQNIVHLGRAARKQANIRVRQPLSRLVVINESGQPAAGLPDLYHVILEELNIKRIEFSNNWKDYYRLEAAPLFDKIGPRFGKEAPHVAEAVRKLTAEQVAEIQRNGSLSVETGGGEKLLTLDEVAINVVPANGYAAASAGHLTVAIELAITRELQAEGFARELINRIQNMRKEAGLKVTDRIRLGISRSETAVDAIERFGDYIKNETLAVELDNEVSRSIKREWEIDGVKTLIALEKT